MRKHNFVIIRYNLLDYSQSVWKMGKKNSFDEYKNRLFDQERLSDREFMLENITLASLSNMDPDDNFTLLIITSDEMPEHNLDNLKQIIEPYPWCKAHVTSSKNKIGSIISSCVLRELQQFKEKVHYSTTRLDDDDALAYYFQDSLNQYMGKVGHCVTFPVGYSGIYESNEFKSIHYDHIPKVAIGLSHINTYDPRTNTFGHERSTIYNLGNHTKVDLVCPTIFDEDRPMFLRTIHSKSDSVSKNIIQSVKDKELASNGVLKDLFGINL